jgi:GTPase
MSKNDLNNYDNKSSFIRSKREQVFSKENDYGSIEYKRKLIKLTEQRINQLATQMKHRLIEGNNSATYLIGINDNGTLYQLTDDEMTESIETFKKITEITMCEIVSLNKINSKTGTYLKINIECRFNICSEIKIALIGESGVGKTTLMSVLLYNSVDDGNGKARSYISKHLHELDTGCTSSIVYDSFGISSNGDILNYKDNMTQIEIAQESTKLITLIDLPGERKYIKTTLYGLNAYKPHHIFYVIDTEKKADVYYDFLNSIGIPWTLIMNKIDKSDFFINCNNKKYITTSCVMDNGLDDLKQYIINLTHNDTKYDTNNIEFLINEVYNIKDLGIVVNGLLIKGIISPNNKLYLNKNDTLVTIKSIHKHQLPHSCLKPNELASLMIEIDENKLYLLDKQSWLYSNPEFNKKLVNTFNIKLSKKIKQNNVIISSNNYIGAGTVEYIDETNNIATVKLINKDSYINYEEGLLILKNNDELVCGLKL